MSKKTYRLGVSEVNLVNRRLALESPIADDQLNAAVSEIDQLYGIESVALVSKRAMLMVSYDASRLCIQCVEDVLAMYSVRLKGDWWTRFKEEHYRFVDQNVKDNVSHEPWSCHRMPRHTRM